MKRLYILGKLHKTSRELFIIIFSLVIISVLAIFLFHRDRTQLQGKYLVKSNFCLNDNDCLLYECSKCGNKAWIEENINGNIDCHQQISGLVGCACRQGVCMRQYDKK